MRLGRVRELTEHRAMAAADAALRHRLTIAHAVVYSPAIEHGGTLWTQDADYHGLPSVRYFPKGWARASSIASP